MDATPPSPIGLRHVALRVRDLPAAERFYCGLLGLHVEWRPDPDNVYLAGRGDSLALHRVAALAPVAAQPPGRLDHLGFALRRAEDVDAWHAHLTAAGVRMLSAPKTHRDGARSFYCEDPDGNVVQMIWHPPIAALEPA